MSTTNVDMVSWAILEEKASLFDDAVARGLTRKSKRLIELEETLLELKRAGKKEITDAGPSSPLSTSDRETIQKLEERRKGEKKAGFKEKKFEIKGLDPDQYVFEILPGSPTDNLGFENVSNEFNPLAYQQEIDQLMQLPRSVIVVTWENRRNLLQVLVLGPNNTIYEDILFVFTLLIPDNYPNDLPRVRHYYSNIGIGGRISNGVLEDNYIEELWQKGRIAGIITGIQDLGDGGGFFEDEAGGGSRTMIHRGWDLLHETIVRPPVHFENVIHNYFLDRFGYLLLKKELDLKRKTLKKQERKAVIFYWRSIKQILLNKDKGKFSKGKDKWLKFMSVFGIKLG